MKLKKLFPLFITLSLNCTIEKNNNNQKRRYRYSRKKLTNARHHKKPHSHQHSNKTYTLKIDNAPPVLTCGILHNDLADSSPGLKADGVFSAINKKKPYRKTCKHCGKKLTNIKRHEELYCPENQNKAYTTCNHCGEKLRIQQKSHCCPDSYTIRRRKQILKLYTIKLTELELETLYSQSTITSLKSKSSKLLLPRGEEDQLSHLFDITPN